MLAACSNNDERKWEPALVVSLASFDVDISKYLGIDSLTENLFREIPHDFQENSLTRAFTVLRDSVGTSVIDSLPLDIQTAIYSTITIPTTPLLNPAILLDDLMKSLRERGQFFVINRIAYEIMEEVRGLPDTSFRAKVDSLFATSPPVNIGDAISIDMQQVADFEEMKQIQWIKIQVFVSSRLQVKATVQADMRDDSGNVIDSLLYADGKNGVEMPFPQSAGSKVHILHSYEGQDAKRLIASIGRFTVNISSPSLGLTLNQVKHLHNQRVTVSMGLMLKTTFGDAVE
jgi:hypothetical protein